MDISIDVVAKIIQKKHRSGAASPELVEWLHARGFSITDSIKVLRRALGCSLQDAKEQVARHSLWARQAALAEPLHDELEEAFRQEDPPGDA